MRISDWSSDVCSSDREQCDRLMSDCARPGVTILAARCEIVIDRKGQLSEPKVHVVVEHIIPNLGRLPLAGKSAGVKSAAAQVDPDVAIPQQPTDALLAV